MVLARMARYPLLNRFHYFSLWVFTNVLEGKPPYVEFMKKNYPPGFTYASFAKQFQAEFFNPHQWAEILNSSGAK